VPEMPGAGEDHGDTTLVGCGDHLGITDGAPGLDSRSSSSLGGSDQAVREGKEGIGTDHTPFEREPRLTSFPNGDTRRINT
jgi:hypothetical protein